MGINQHETKRPVFTCECGAHSWLPLTRGFVALVSPTDAAFVGQWNWTALFMPGRSPRAVRRENGDGKMRYLHRDLPGMEPAPYVDHINGDTLDDRRENLRPCSRSENLRNSRRKHYARSSRFKGVYFDKGTGRWAADIRAGQRIRLGRFDTEIAAALAYDRKAVELHGEFARTNQSLGLLP